MIASVAEHSPDVVDPHDALVAVAIVNRGGPGMIKAIVGEPAASARKAG